MIHAENIVKSYNNGRTEVLKGVSLDIASGEFVTILGASGSGKSTLMNILSGLERADGGTVTVDGERLGDKSESELTAFRRHVTGFVFQQYYLLPHLNVLNNVRMGATLSSETTDFMPIIEALGLKDKLKSMPSELSGGEQQRVCIARAIAKAPKILFLDEPTGALDEATGRGVLDCIAKERERLGFTTVMVTHNANIAEMSETVVRLNSGKIVEKYRNAKQKTAYEIGW